MLGPSSPGHLLDWNINATASFDRVINAPGETGESHGHRRTHGSVTAETAAAAATEAAAAPASGCGLKLQPA
jgi:hypothetical protein